MTFFTLAKLIGVLPKSGGVWTPGPVGNRRLCTVSTVCWQQPTTWRTILFPHNTHTHTHTSYDSSTNLVQKWSKKFNQSVVTHSAPRKCGKMA